MVAVFGTLGYRPKSLIPTIRSTKDVDKVVFYCGADKSDPDAVKKVAEARKAVLDYCRTMKIAADAVDLEDPFDFKRVAARIRGDIRKHKKEGKEVAVFNIAGGTRPTSSAALLACILEGVPTVYVHDLTYEEIRLPLLKWSTARSFRERRGSFSRLSPRTSPRISQRWSSRGLSGSTRRQ